MCTVRCDCLFLFHLSCFDTSLILFFKARDTDGCNMFKVSLPLQACSAFLLTLAYMTELTVQHKDTLACKLMYCKCSVHVVVIFHLVCMLYVSVIILYVLD